MAVVVIPEADYPARLPTPIRVQMGRPLTIELPTATSSIVNGTVVVGPAVDWTGLGTFQAQTRPDLDPMSAPSNHMLALTFAVALVNGTPVLTLTGDQTALMLPERSTFWSFELVLIPTGQIDPLSIVVGTLVPERTVYR